MKRLMSIVLLLLLIPAAFAEPETVRLEFEAFCLDVPGDWYVFQEPEGEARSDEAFLYLWPSIEGENLCSLNACRTLGTADSFSGYNEYSARSVARAAAEALGGTDVALTQFEKGERDGHDTMRYAYSMAVDGEEIAFVQLLWAMGEQGVYIFTVTLYDPSELAQFEPVLDSIQFS